MKGVAISPLRLVQVALVVACLSAVLGGAHFVWSHHQRMTQLLSDIAARHARLQGILKSEPDFRALHQQARDLVGIYSYPSQQDVTQAGNDAQQRIQGVFVAQGLSVASIQVLAPQAETVGFDLIPVQVQAEGDIEAMNKALQALVVAPAAGPRIGMRGVQIQSVGMVRAEEKIRLTGRFQFFVLREQP